MVFTPICYHQKRVSNVHVLRASGLYESSITTRIKTIYLQLLNLYLFCVRDHIPLKQGLRPAVCRSKKDGSALLFFGSVVATY